MKAVIVYESLWGNTAAVAKAIAAGLGPGVPALSTREAGLQDVSGSDLIVAGAPLLGFSLPTEAMRASIRGQASTHKVPPDLSSPTMRAWLAELPRGSGRCAAFETRIWWSPGSAAGTILTLLNSLGYQPLEKGARFIITGTYGPMKAGELERARLWGEALARKMG